MLNVTRTFQIEEVMAYAVMVYNKMGYKSPGMTVGNRGHLNYYLGVMPRPKDSRIYEYEDVPSEDERELAEEICRYYRRLLLSAFGGKVNNFEAKLLESIHKGIVTATDFGVIAAVPKAYEKEVLVKQWKKDAIEYARTSQHFGEVGQMTTKTMTIRRVSHIDRLAAYLVEGIDDQGNLFVLYDRFVSRDIKPGVTDRFLVRVKRHQVSRINNGQETVLSHMEKVGSIDQRY